MLDVQIAAEADTEGNRRSSCGARADARKQTLAPEFQSDAESISSFRLFHHESRAVPDY